MKQSLRERIIKYFKGRPDLWINGGDIERLALENGYKASNASRRCRELREDGILQRKEERGSVWYQYQLSIYVYN